MIQNERSWEMDMCSAFMVLEQKRHGPQYRKLLIIPCSIVLYLD